MKTSYFQTGAAMILFVLFFTFATTAIMFILGRGIFADLSDYNRLAEAKLSYLAAESAAEDVVLRRVFESYAIDSVESVTINDITAYATSTYDSAEDSYVISAAAQNGITLRKAEVEMSISGGSAFNYGLQAGTGGIELSNSSSVIGNVYSNGPIEGQGSATIYGDMVSAGPSGLAEDITATGSIYANTIDGIDAGGDAHYNVQIGTNGQNPVAGTRFTPATNLPTTSFPISTTTIQEWKDAVDSFGTVIASTDPACSGGEYEIDSSISLGYVRIECDVNIRKKGASVVVTLTGPVWVEGDLAFTQGPEIRVDASLGRRSAQFIVDNESNRTTSSRIEIRNSTDFFGSGDNRSYVLLLSANESSSLGGTEIAIDVGQSANGDVLVYTNEGLVDIGNNIDLRSVTGHQIDLSNGSSVTYESGLADLVFTSGPGGAYQLDDWGQVE